MKWNAFYILSIAVLVATATAVVRVSAANATGDAASGATSEVQIGIANHLKVARWAQVRVGMRARLISEKLQVNVAAPDNDGVRTVSSAPVSVPTGGEADRGVRVYTNVGMFGAPIEISLVQGRDKVESHTISPGVAPDGTGFIGLPATAELILYFGPRSPQALDAHTARNPASGEVLRKAANTDRISELPDDWFGYDAVDLAVMSIGDGGPIDEYCASFADDEKRFGAFVRWIELGGRLVIFCGGQSAEELFGAGRPLAALLPGKLADVVSLPGTGRLEHFAGSEVPIAAREPIRVPRLVEVDGKIELYEGRQASNLPLVVRAPRGLGEISFVAVNPFQPPLADWPGRKGFMDAVMRPYLEEDRSAHGTQKLVTRGYNDMSGALRQNLGRTFAGVRPFTFSLITVFAIGYLLVLGPLDYFVTQRFKQAWAAWVTFPVIVLLFGGLALALVERRHGGDELRINQLELVDIDTTTGHARGTVWSTVYSPRAGRLDVRLDVEPLSKETGGAAARLHSWALPGAGIGGTQSGGKNLVADEGYRYGERLGELIGVPILTSGTKSLLARWTAPADAMLIAELTDEDGLVTGSIQNRTGRRLRNARLYYGDWAYRLPRGGTVADGEQIEIGEELRPRSLKTIVTQDSFATADRNQSGEQMFVAERASLGEILNVMMFYEAVGGFSFAQLQNRFQAYCDLSRMATIGRALLVADVETTGSRLVDAKTGEGIGEQETAAVVYRFVLPVGSASTQ